MQYSNDVGTDKNWITFVNVDDGKGSWEKFDFDPITARFVRLYATASNGVGSAKPISIWEKIGRASCRERVSSPV